MLRIALCDDRPEDQAGLLELLKAYRQIRREVELACHPYPDASSLLDAGIDFDIFLLDILMPGLNGIELGQELRRKYPMAPILYLTTSQDFALDSYRTEAMCYLTKPVSREELFRSLDRAVDRCVREKARAVAVPVADGVRRLYYYELAYAEAERWTLRFYLLNGDMLSSSGRKLKFAQLWEELEGDGRFLLVRRGCLVNMDAVEWMGEGELELADGIRIAFPRGRRGEIRRLYLSYCRSQFGAGGGGR